MPHCNDLQPLKAHTHVNTPTCLLFVFPLPSLHCGSSSWRHNGRQRQPGPIVPSINNARSMFLLCFLSCSPGELVGSNSLTHQQVLYRPFFRSGPSQPPIIYCQYSFFLFSSLKLTFFPCTPTFWPLVLIGSASSKFILPLVKISGHLSVVFKV